MQTLCLVTPCVPHDHDPSRARPPQLLQGVAGVLSKRCPKAPLPLHRCHEEAPGTERNVSQGSAQQAPSPARGKTEVCSRTPAAPIEEVGSNQRNFSMVLWGVYLVILIR